ncbi:MAG TPA: aromatic-ring-hydroxylating dioxygenase subunit beta [Beijerinckiaceae bacterium]|jgi:benzoate/toluate 1,2-dioxygenase beta subunit/2,4,5-trichlorophenoxyacetic acid oxygenase 2
MTGAEAAAIAASVIHREGLLLDRKDWDAWLDLYCDDAVYWVPAWLDEYRITEDPDAQVSLIYHTARRELEERVQRIRSRKSVTALPLPRTTHAVANLVVESFTPERIEAAGAWTVHVYDTTTAKQHVHFGLHEYTLRRDGRRWRIARKKATLMNDRVPTALDFYHL